MVSPFAGSEEETSLSERNQLLYDEPRACVLASPRTQVTSKISMPHRHHFTSPASHPDKINSPSVTLHSWRPGVLYIILHSTGSALSLRSQHSKLLFPRTSSLSTCNNVGTGQVSQEILDYLHTALREPQPSDQQK